MAHKDIPDQKSGPLPEAPRGEIPRYDRAPLPSGPTLPEPTQPEHRLPPVERPPDSIPGRSSRYAGLSQSPAGDESEEELYKDFLRDEQKKQIQAPPDWPVLRPQSPSIQYQKLLDQPGGINPISPPDARPGRPGLYAEVKDVPDRKKPIDPLAPSDPREGIVPPEPVPPAQGLGPLGEYVKEGAVAIRRAPREAIEGLRETVEGAPERYRAGYGAVDREGKGLGGALKRVIGAPLSGAYNVIAGSPVGHAAFDVGMNIPHMPRAREIPHEPVPQEAPSEALEGEIFDPVFNRGGQDVSGLPPRNPKYPLPGGGFAEPPSMTVKLTRDQKQEMEIALSRIRTGMGGEAERGGYTGEKAAGMIEHKKGIPGTERRHSPRPMSIDLIPMRAITKISGD